MKRDVAVALEVWDPPEDGVVGASAATHRVDDREPDGDDERLEHAEEDDAACGDRRDRDLDSVDRREARQAAGSTMLIPAATMTAPRTAWGRYCTGWVRKRRTTTIAPAENRPATWVRAPTASFTAVRAPLHRPRIPA